MTCDILVQKQDSEASNLQRDLSNDVGEILLQHSSSGFAGDCKPPPLHKLLSSQGAQDIMSTAAGIGSMLFDELQGKATWLQGKFLQ